MYMTGMFLTASPHAAHTSYDTTMGNKGKSSLQSECDYSQSLSHDKLFMNKALGLQKLATNNLSCKVALMFPWS